MKYIFKKNNIFIAGHRGMVGSAIKRNLENNGYLNLLTAKRSELDLTNLNMVNNWYKDNKPEIVIIAAAKVGGILANSKFPTEFLLNNMKIQNNLIEGAWKNDVKRLLFLGSSCIYQNLHLNQSKKSPTNGLFRIFQSMVCNSKNSRYRM